MIEPFVLLFEARGDAEDCGLYTLREVQNLFVDPYVNEMTKSKNVVRDLVLYTKGLI